MGPGVVIGVGPGVVIGVGPGVGAGVATGVGDGVGDGVGAVAPPAQDGLTNASRMPESDSAAMVAGGADGVTSVTAIITGPISGVDVCACVGRMTESTTGFCHFSGIRADVATTPPALSSFLRPDALLSLSSVECCDGFFELGFFLSESLMGSLLNGKAGNLVVD